MLPNSDIIDKQILYRYSRSFDFLAPDIGLFKTKEGNCSMVLQLPYGFEQFNSGPHIDGLLTTRMIMPNDVVWAYSKTIEFSSAAFDKLYEDIVNSLATLIQVDFPTGEDGDDLSVEIEDFHGHSCKIRFWSPQEYPEDCYHFNAIYAGFVEVLEVAGLLDWYAQ
jgi:hypothetical protein